MPGKEKKMTQVDAVVNVLMKNLLANTLLVFTSMRVLIYGMLFSRMYLNSLCCFVVNKPGICVLKGYDSRE